VVEVQQRRHYDVNWRFISLAMINKDRTDDWYTPQYRAGHQSGLRGLRIADQIRIEHGNSAVAVFYTALGDAIHRQRRAKEFRDEPLASFAGLLSRIELPELLAAHALDDSHDAHIAADTELALTRAGRDVGTPILTFRPGAPDEGSFFGPVVASIPRGPQAVRLWDAVELIATTSGMAELKRSGRAAPTFD
jgi:hypothetical protein